MCIAVSSLEANADNTLTAYKLSSQDYSVWTL